MNVLKDWDRNLVRKEGKFGSWIIIIEEYLPPLKRDLLYQSALQEGLLNVELECCEWNNLYK